MLAIVDPVAKYVGCTSGGRESLAVGKGEGLPEEGLGRKVVSLRKNNRWFILTPTTNAARIARAIINT